MTKRKKFTIFVKKIAQLFKEALTEICTFSVFLNAHLGFENFATIFACFNLLIQNKICNFCANFQLFKKLMKKNQRALSKLFSI